MKAKIGWRFCLYLICLPAIVPFAQAASFDCAKAASKVERQICDTPALSRLDDELAEIYGRALKLADDKDELMREQRRWLQARNRKCESTSGPNMLLEKNCLVRSYQNRIERLIAEHKQLDGYTLLMSRDDRLCHHMLQLFTNDLQKYGRGSNDHDEFKAVPWVSSRISYEDHGATRFWNVEGALFDFNNDGKLDFVVRNHGMLSSMPADSISVFPPEVATRTNELTVKEFFDARNRIAIAGTFYPMDPPFAEIGEPLWLLSPFIYHGVSYVYMQTFYEPAGFKGQMTPDVMVIGKYIGGRFVDRDLSGQMENICYYKRFGVEH